jgi:hypothetical protein
MGGFEAEYQRQAEKEVRSESELEPSFWIKVFLDGDDDAAIQTENVRDTLVETVEKMKEDGLIREGSVIEVV